MDFPTRTRWILDHECSLTLDENVALNNCNYQCKECLWIFGSDTISKVRLEKSFVISIIHTRSLCWCRVQLQRSTVRRSDHALGSGHQSFGCWNAGTDTPTLKLEKAIYQKICERITTWCKFQEFWIQENILLAYKAPHSQYIVIQYVFGCMELEGFGWKWKGVGAIKSKFYLQTIHPSKIQLIIYSMVF